MRLVRTYWQDQLCKTGFKSVALAGAGIFSGSHEYALRCPKTPDERTSFAASLQSDFQNQSIGAIVLASGPKSEVLSLVVSSDAFQSAANRAAFFHQMENRGLVEGLCSQGFKQVRIRYGPRESNTSRFPLKCGGRE